MSFTKRVRRLFRRDARSSSAKLGFECLESHWNPGYLHYDSFATSLVYNPSPMETNGLTLTGNNSSFTLADSGSSMGMSYDLLYSSYFSTTSTTITCTGLTFVTLSISGSDGNDTLDASAFTGTAQLTLLGDTGTDTITGSAGADSLVGGDSADSIIGGAGSDTIEGGNGNDVLAGGDGDDSILGGAGSDTIDGEDGDDDLFGEADDDIIHGGDGDNSIVGGDGADFLVGFDGNDSMQGDNGTDTLCSGGGTDSITGGAPDSIDPAYISYVSLFGVGYVIYDGGVTCSPNTGPAEMIVGG